jgi:hypothetical protein
MSILIKIFIFKYILWFIHSDMCLVHANIQTAGLKKLVKGILLKNIDYGIKTKRRKSTLCLLFHVRLFFTDLPTLYSSWEPVIEPGWQ